MDVKHQIDEWFRYERYCEMVGVFNVTWLEYFDCRCCGRSLPGVSGTMMGGGHAGGFLCGDCLIIDLMPWGHRDCPIMQSLLGRFRWSPQHRYTKEDPWDTPPIPEAYRIFFELGGHWPGDEAHQPK